MKIKMMEKLLAYDPNPDQSCIFTVGGLVRPLIKGNINSSFGTSQRLNYQPVCYKTDS